ncbi:hypothetical protein [Amycolatopsis sp. NPDC102389]
MVLRPEPVMFNSLGTRCAGDLYLPEVDTPPGPPGRRHSAACP